jgi:hypothetical protein
MFESYCHARHQPSLGHFTPKLLPQSAVCHAQVLATVYIHHAQKLVYLAQKLVYRAQSSKFYNGMSKH